MQQPSRWICDTCGEFIEEPSHGWLQWLTEDYPKGQGLQIVHGVPWSRIKRRMGCMYDESAKVSDVTLDRLQGADGLMTLLEFLSEDNLPREELLEIFKRLWIPGYEVARFHFQRAIQEGAFSPNAKEGYHQQSDIEAVLRWLKEQEE